MSESWYRGVTQVGESLHFGDARRTFEGAVEDAVLKAKDIILSSPRDQLPQVTIFVDKQATPLFTKRVWVNTTNDVVVGIGATQEEANRIAFEQALKKWPSARYYYQNNNPL